MKNSQLTILLLLFSTSIIAQTYDFDFDKIEFSGLGFFVSKEDVIQKNGKHKIAYPKYECGYHSILQSGSPYYQLIYKNFTYIGCDTETFQLENISFDLKGCIIMKIGNTKISGLTTKDEFLKLFGEHLDEMFQKNKDSEIILLFSKDREDGAKFIFKNEKLIRFEYWSPC